ncbi:MAG: hypothetical protein EOO62_05925 [Hymenobacter sp.]|nr:MAG: hypothetical protein EOO62_05925 [Hymenobacter sp.]
MPSDFINCYPTPGRTNTATGTSRTTNSGYNPYGYDVTARGDLRVLIVYAGFTNDIDSRSPDYGNSDWPQTDATHLVAGTTFPANVNDVFYSSSTQFSATATDHTLSNFYYQMSQFSSSPFRLSAAVYPKRINVTADDATSAANGFLTYSDQVMQAIKNDPAPPSFNFSQVDNRQGTPSFQTDTSVPGTDNIVDYTIIVWRNPGVPYQLQLAPNYGGGGYASVPYTTNLPSTNGQFYQVDKGFTQTGGLSGLNIPLFAHEFAHTLYSAPHSLLAGAVVGQYFNATEGPGMMSQIRTYFAANAWERWFNGWAELLASGVSTDIQDINSLAATGGVYTLRDYVTTGDMMRIKLPGSSNQYVWLENHQGKSVFDDRINFIYDGQTPAQLMPTAPRGIVAMVEDMSPDRSLPLDYFQDKGVNGLKTLSAQGNFDYTPSATNSIYNNHLYGNALYDFTNLVANPFGGESQISRHRFDADHDGTIFWNPTQGNGGNNNQGNEQQYSVVVNGAFEDGLLGPNIAFNVGSRRKKPSSGKLGISYPTPIFEHQHYDPNATKLSPITVSGLSVELTSQDASTGAITIRVRFDDANIVANTRWTGDLVLAPNLNVSVSGATLTINKSKELICSLMTCMALLTVDSGDVTYYFHKPYPRFMPGWHHDFAEYRQPIGCYGLQHKSGR